MALIRFSNQQERADLESRDTYVRSFESVGCHIATAAVCAVIVVDPVQLSVTECERTACLSECYACLTKNSGWMCLPVVASAQL